MTHSETHRGLVLVVEDDLDFSEFLTTTLDDHGFSTEVVMDGDQVVERARTLRPRGITLDLLLPGRTGIAIYRSLRNHVETRDIPVVIITGVGTEGKKLAVDRFFRGRSIPPPEGVLQKPVDAVTVLAAVEAAITMASSRGREIERIS